MEQVCIIGVGFVGEHLIEAFSKNYFVIGYDVSPARVIEMRTKFQDNENVLIQSTTNNLESSKLFCISVPTFLLQDNRVDDRYIRSAIKLVEKVALPKSIVVMESSVYVGMTRTLLKSLREKDIYVGFSPERVDPGRTDPPVDKIHKIISGYDVESLEQIQKYYKNAFENLVPVSKMEVAEMCKLVENCFRMINIAYINEISDACEQWKINPYELVHACATKPFGYMPFYPSLGVGGHCIPVNPYWLAINNNVPFLKMATELMFQRPIKEAMKLLRDAKIKKVLVVGIAFKTGESLTTNASGLAYAKELQKLNADTYIYDPLVRLDDPTVKRLKRIDNSNWNLEFLDTFDVICIAIKQRGIDYNILKGCKHAKIVAYCEL